MLKKLPSVGNKKDFELKYYALRVRGHVYMEFRNFPKAIKYYRKAKFFCERKQRFKEKLQMYE